MVRIESLQSQHLPQVQALVNQHLSAVIPGWGVSLAYLAGRLERNPGQYVVDPWVVERKTLCALDRERVVAARPICCPTAQARKWANFIRELATSPGCSFGRHMKKQRLAGLPGDLPDDDAPLLLLFARTDAAEANAR